MPLIAAILALLVGIAGWFYLFYSKAAHRLAAVEASPVNRLRQRLRRLNGAVMVVIAALFYTGFAINPDLQKRTYLAVWSGVMLLLLVVLALAVIDLRLTASIRRRLRQSRPEIHP